MTDILTMTRDHLDSGGLMAGYASRFGRFTDADAKGVPFVLFREHGTEGAQTNYVLQLPDVFIMLVDNAGNRQQARQRCVDMRAYLRENYQIPGGLNIEPIGGLSGPFQLTDGREYFQFVVRLIVSDY